MKRWIVAGMTLVLSGWALGATPAQHFFEPERVKEVKISPSGRYVALRVGSASQRDAMAVLDSESLAMVGGTRLGMYDIGNIRWVNDKRLVYNVVDYKASPYDWDFAPGLYGVNRDGKEMRQLASHQWADENHAGTNIKAKMEPWNTYLMEEDGAQDSDFIYVRRPVWNRTSHAIDRVDLVRLNTITGAASYVERPATPQEWMLDHKGQPSIVFSLQNGERTVHYRDPASNAWRAVATFPAYGMSKDGIAPTGFLDDQHMLVVTRKHGDKASLHVMDMASGKVNPDAMVGMADFDFDGEMVYSGKRLVGIHYLADARSSAWFDSGMKASQAQVDKLMPGMVNILTPPLHPEVPWILVSSHSDRQPRFFSLYNKQTNEIKGIGGTRPAINAAEMGQQSMVKYKARDGMEIPAWLTLPAKGGKKLPLVVLVHGGPYLRGTEWGWNSDSQFLASRGYAVIEPEFRGSTGYGHKLFSAGLKQWGLKMQDDIADSVKWAVEKGVADARRICIMGGSYGGYATLMGLVNDPDLYRCGVAYAAVTDIPLLFSSGVARVSDLSDAYRTYGAPYLVGDVEKDAEQLVATSPLKQAARIKTPLLLAHGSDDHRVPIDHFRKLRSALRSHDAPAEFVEYGEGHGWFTPESRIDFWNRVDQFLERHIGAGAKSN
jgi:acetyl esterase/lipase